MRSAGDSLSVLSEKVVEEFGTAKRIVGDTGVDDAVRGGDGVVHVGEETFDAFREIEGGGAVCARWERVEEVSSSLMLEEERSTLLRVLESEASSGAVSPPAAKAGSRCAVSGHGGLYSLYAVREMEGEGGQGELIFL